MTAPVDNPDWTKHREHREELRALVQPLVGAAGSAKALDYYFGPSQVIELLDRVDVLEKQLRDEQIAHENTVDQRDRAEEWADKLAYTIAPQDVIGEHSTMNNPWQNALDQL